MKRVIRYIVFCFLLSSAGVVGYGQKQFLSEYANEQIKSIPQQQQDSFYMIQGENYLAYKTNDGYKKAMECYLEALKLATEYHHTNTLLNCYDAISNIYAKNNNLQQALKYNKLHYEKTLKQLPFSSENLFLSCYKITDRYVQLKDTSKAHLYNLKMAEILNWINDAVIKDKYKLLIAYNNIRIGKRNEFLSQFEALQHNIIYKDEPNLHLGRIFAECKTYYTLLKTNNKNPIEPLLEELKTTTDSANILNSIVTIYEQQQQYKEAYTYLKLLLQKNENESYRSAQGNTNYRLREADILAQQKANNELKLSAEAYRYKNIVILCVAALFALLLVITLYYLIKGKHKKQTIIDKQETEEAHLLQIQEERYQLYTQFKNWYNDIELVALKKIKVNALPGGSSAFIQIHLASIRIAQSLLAEQKDSDFNYNVPLQEYFEQLTDLYETVFRLPVDAMKLNIQMNHNHLNIAKLLMVSLVMNEIMINKIQELNDYDIDIIEINLNCSFYSNEYHFQLDFTANNGSISNLNPMLTKDLQKMLRNNDAKYFEESPDATQSIRIILS
jgi:hypothetical protein